MGIENLYFLFTLFFLFLFIGFYYLNYKYHKYDSFKNYVQIITALSTLILAIGVLFQVLAFKISEDTNIVQSFMSFYKDYFDSIVEIFSEHPEMNYYYNELFNGKQSNMYKNYHYSRDIVLEHQINTRIFVKTVEQIALINIYNNVPSIEILNTLVIKLLSNFFKSDTFRNYYIHYYKPHLAVPMTIHFIQKNFGI